MRDYKCKVIRIQRYYKGRSRMKRRSATVVQRMLRGYQCNRRVAWLMQTSKGTQTLLAVWRRYEQRQAV